MVVGDEGDGGSGPEEDPGHVGTVAEGRGEGVTRRRAARRRSGQGAPRVKDEQRRHDVLDADAGVRAGDADEQLDVGRDQSHQRRRQQRQQREEEAAHEEAVLGVVAADEQLLQVVAQRDRHHRERRAQREHGEQRQEVREQHLSAVRCTCRRKSIRNRLLFVNFAGQHQLFTRQKLATIPPRWQSSFSRSPLIDSFSSICSISFSRNRKAIALQINLSQTKLTATYLKQVRFSELESKEKQNHRPETGGRKEDDQ